ncbi:MAG: homoserine kinase [Solirubrobacteraceae bacterium]
MRVHVRVPGSTANLGPGFDVLAAALGLHLDLEVVQTGTFAVVTDLDLRRDRENLVVRAFERLHPAEGFEFRIRSEIPLSGGVGSSAAGVVAGLMAAAHVLDQGADILALATELEGHPDNVAASLIGGLVICDGVEAHPAPLPDELEGVLVVPSAPVSTALARAALPETVPLADAVRNMAQISKLVLGLASSDWDLIAGGLHDRLHQPYRTHLYPDSAAILDLAPEIGALGATISGAGPTVLVWCRRPDTARVVAALEPEVRDWARVLSVAFAQRGAQLVSG